MAEQTMAFILRDAAGEYYAIPEAALAAYRVPAAYRALVERLVDAMIDLEERS